MNVRRPIWPNPSPRKVGRAVRTKISPISPKMEFFNKIGFRLNLVKHYSFTRPWTRGRAEKWSKTSSIVSRIAEKESKLMLA